MKEKLISYSIIILSYVCNPARIMFYTSSWLLTMIISVIPILLLYFNLNIYSKIENVKSGIKFLLICFIPLELIVIRPMLLRPMGEFVTQYEISIDCLQQYVLYMVLSFPVHITLIFLVLNLKFNKKK